MNFEVNSIENRSSVWYNPTKTAGGFCTAVAQPDSSPRRKTTRQRESPGVNALRPHDADFCLRIARLSGTRQAHDHLSKDPDSNDFLGDQVNTYQDILMGESKHKKGFHKPSTCIFGKARASAFGLYYPLLRIQAH